MKKRKKKNKKQIQDRWKEYVKKTIEINKEGNTKKHKLKKEQQSKYE